MTHPSREHIQQIHEIMNEGVKSTQNYEALSFPNNIILVGDKAHRLTEVGEIIFKIGWMFDDMLFCTESKCSSAYDHINSLFHKDITLVTGYEDIPSIDWFDEPEVSTLVIFDESIGCKHERAKVEEYFLRSRRYNVSCLYSTTSYFSIPKFIRENSKYVFVLNDVPLGDVGFIIGATGMFSKRSITAELERSSDRGGSPYLVVDKINNRVRRRLYPMSDCDFLI